MQSRDTNGERRRTCAPRVAFAVTAALAAAAPVLAQTEASPPEAASADGTPTTSSNTHSANATVNLIRLLVARGVLSAEQAEELVAQANSEAAAARAVQNTVASDTTPATVVAATPAPAPTGTMRVTYVPESVKKQLREEIRAEVMEQAKQENWAAPNSLPGWASRLNMHHDVRARYDGSYFPNSNEASGAFPNFNAINTGAPYDVSEANPNFAPQLNVDQDRNRYRIRARFGFDAALDRGFKSAIRLATGDSSSPVSANQSLGQDGGDFSKYAIWLDRASIAYQSPQDARFGFSFQAGRFDNPFLSTNLLWDEDLGFDGVALGARFAIRPAIVPYLTAGAFPVFNSDFHFATNQPKKIDSSDKWLYALQSGVDWQLGDDVGLKFAAAYYLFDGVEGELSSPCLVLSTDDACDTDETRPSFAQKGNSYMAVRNIVPTASNAFGSTDQFQYFGLATAFRELVLTTQLRYDGFGPVRITFTGEYVRNLAFDRNVLQRDAVNNRGALTDGVADFDGGDTGYLFGLTVGTPGMQQRWDWNVGLSYRHLESDAVVDGFTDSDFGLGGTNLEGYVLSGGLALARQVWLSMRWLSADSIGGPPFGVDVAQLDLNTRF